MSYTKVNRHNLSSLLRSIKSSIESSSFIAIDTEFTGLGESKKTRVQNIEDRYLALKQVVTTHSVIAVGLSLFTPRTSVRNVQETVQNASEKVPESALPETSRNDALKASTQTAPLAPNHYSDTDITLSDDVIDTADSAASSFHVENFQFSLLSLMDHTISPSSMSFLVEHGFDFNDQYRNGIPYLPGNELSEQERTSTFKQRNLDCHYQFREIIISLLYRKCPIILHNGLLDLMFIYQSFYAQLPSTLPVFVADCSEMFLGGIYDTKYISDFITREPASFLALLFRKYQRQQQDRKEGASPFLDIQFVDSIKQVGPAKNNLKLHELGLAPKVNHKIANSKRKQSTKSYCEQFANHGFCLDGKDCEKSHDLDIILDDIEGKTSKKTRTDIASDTNADNHVVDNSNQIKGGNNKRQQATVSSSDLGNLFEQDHSACFDAFMTGYVFSHQCMVTDDAIVQEAKNKIYLIGKQIPLLIEKSRFAKPSTGHLLQKPKYC